MEGKIVRVLIVDDEPLSRSSLENALRARNDIQALDCANDAVDALELLQKKPYDVLLLDIHMPELSGIELADRLNKWRRPIPSIVFVTAHHQYAVAAFEKHAVDYVLKPFSDDRVHEALDTAIRRTESDRGSVVAVSENRHQDERKDPFCRSGRRGDYRSSRQLRLVTAGFRIVPTPRIDLLDGRKAKTVRIYKNTPLRAGEQLLR
jgi:DNA-binding LytR/AlgR family response regulator